MMPHLTLPTLLVLALFTLPARAQDPVEVCPENLLGSSGPAQYLPPEASRGGTLRRAATAIPERFQPFQEGALLAGEVARYVVGAVAHRDVGEPSTWTGDLAHCVEVDPTGLIYTVHLREGLRWHPVQDAYLGKGKWLQEEHPLHADDFLFALEIFRHPDVAGAARLRSTFEGLERAERVDAHTFRLIWSVPSARARAATLALQPLPRWIYGMSPEGEPLPEDAVAEGFESHWYRHMMGAGPYQLATYEARDFVQLSRFEGYHGEAPAFDDILYVGVASPELQWSLFEAGELDVITLTAQHYRQHVLEAGEGSRLACPNTFGELPAGKELAYIVYPILAFRYLAWNGDGVFFGTIPNRQTPEEARRVRQAMTHALDRERLLPEHLGELAQLTTGPASPESPDYDPSVEPYAFDLERARELLDEAGWKASRNGVREKRGQAFRFTLLVYEHRPEFIALAEAYRDDLEEIGIRMKVETVDWETLQLKMRNREYDAYTGGWSVGFEYAPRAVWHTSQSQRLEGLNYVGFRHSRADHLIDEASTTLDPEARSAILRELHAILHKEQPYTFLYTEKSALAFQPQLRHVVAQRVRPHDLALSWYWSAKD